jgi:hypothetical protein
MSIDRPDGVNDDVRDSMGELANMVHHEAFACGPEKTYVSLVEVDQKAE